MEKQIKQQRWRFFIQNLVAFASLFLCLGLIIFQLLRSSVYFEIDNSLTNMAASEERLEFLLKPRTSEVPGELAEMEEPQVRPSSNFQVQIILRTATGEIVNTGDLGNRLSEYQELKWDDSKLDEIVSLESTGTNGGALRFHIITKELSEELKSTYEPVAYIQYVANTNQIEDTVRQFKWILVICMLAFFLLAFAISFWLAQRSMRPIYQTWQQQQQFVSNASHELRSPLTIIQSKLELLLTKPYEKIIDETESIATSLNETRRLTQLTTDLLMLARSDSGEMKLNRTSVWLPDFIANVCQPYEELAHAQDKLFEIGQVPQQSYSFDEQRLHQVLVILLDNALKYTGKGDGIKVAFSFEEGQLTGQVADTGKGIQKDNREHIFERFYREDESRNRETGGHGLGLSIAKELVAMHQGSLSYQENFPKGSIFTFKIAVS